MPFKRKELKKYKEGPNGYVQGQLTIEPYELDKDTLGVIAKSVYMKLKKDEDLIKKVENEIIREKRFEQYKITKKDQAKQLSEFDYAPKQLDDVVEDVGMLSEFDK